MIIVLKHDVLLINMDILNRVWVLHLRNPPPLPEVLEIDLTSFFFWQTYAV